MRKKIDWEDVCRLELMSNYRETPVYQQSTNAIFPDSKKFFGSERTIYETNQTNSLHTSEISTMKSNLSSQPTCSTHQNEMINSVENSNSGKPRARNIARRERISKNIVRVEPPTHRTATNGVLNDGKSNHSTPRRSSNSQDKNQLSLPKSIETKHEKVCHI